jgi:hypothetical protein
MRKEGMSSHISISSLAVDEDLQILYVVDRGDVIDPASMNLNQAA